MRLFEVAKTELQPFSTEPNTPNQIDMMKNPEYMSKKKGMVGKIEWMSPRDYIDRCIAGFRSVGEPGEVERGREPKLIKRYAQEMQKGDVFPMLELDYRGGFGQEGLHRAMAAEMIGVEKVPVFIMRTSPEWQAKRDAERNAEMDKIKSQLDGWDKDRQSDVVDDILGAFGEGLNESKEMNAEQMLAYLRKHHDKNLHPDYVNHIKSFSSFVLKKVPLSSLKTDLEGLESSKVEKYKKMDFSKAPPIVIGDGYILDGYHRANVAKALNIPNIKAWVGKSSMNESKELDALMTKRGWPAELQKEMYDEWVGRDADEDSFKFVKSLKLQGAQPVTVSTKELLSKQENVDNVSRAPQEVIDAINKKWGTNISIGPQYDPTPERYFKYAKMPAATAKPSIMIDSEIAMGVGRFVAALLRGDKQIKVWDLRSVVNESKLTEGISPVVYHSVNGITSLLSILEQDRFKLTASPGTDTERALQKGDRFYYLSTTRHKLGGYHLNPYRTGFMLNLDGAKLAQRYAGKPVDYWGPDWYANKAQGGKGPEEKEAEDRIYSYKPFIPNASKYIRSIHVLLDPEGYKSQEEFGIYYRRLAILAKKRGIQLFIYKDKQDWLNQNTKRATPASKIDIIAKAKGKDRDQRRLWNHRRQYLAPWIELYMAPTTAELSKEAKDTRYNYVLYGYSDSAQSLAAEIHNAKNKPADETGLETLLKIFRKEKIQTPQEYIDLLKDKWKPKDESE